MKVTAEDVSRISVLLMRLVNKYKRLDSRALEYGTGDFLYPAEIHVIEAIGKNQGSTVNEICLKFGVTKGAISQIVNKLLRKGLIDKTRNPEYHKEIILTLTKRGKRAFEGHERLHGLMDAELYRYVSDFQKEDMKRFEEFLSRIETHIGKFIDHGTRK
ncbi:MAG: MarR family transcriptional regulator [Spirochaetes bacterium]|nr:MarR family transcriptional regulator [Spirochaetota bacterium]